MEIIEAIAQWDSSKHNSFSRVLLLKLLIIVRNQKLEKPSKISNAAFSVFTTEIRRLCNQTDEIASVRQRE